MPRSRGRRKGKRVNIKNSSSGITTPEGKPTSPLQEQETTRSKLLQWWRKPLPKWWILGLGLLALGQTAYNFRPHIEITGAVALDEHDPFATVFLIQNIGPWPLYNLRFGCDIFNGQQQLNVENVVAVTNNEAPLGQAPIAKLSAGEPATRDCLAGPQSNIIRITVPDLAAVRINVNVGYQWPLIGRFIAWIINWSPETSRHFSVRKSPNGQKFLLVPDTEK